MEDVLDWDVGFLTTNDGCQLRYATNSHLSDVEQTIVFTHGFSDNWRCLSPLADAFRDRYRVVLYDSRGHGLSDAPSTEYGPDTRVRDLVEVCTHLNVQNPILYGHSLGADTVANAVSSLEPRAVILEDHPEQLFQARGEEFLIDQRRELHRWTTTPHHELRAEYEREYPEYASMIATARKQVRPQMIRIAEEEFDELAEILPSPNVPVLLLRPDPDSVPYLDPSVDNEWAQATDTVTVDFIENSGHTIHRDQLERTIGRINRFLDREC